MPSDSGAAFVIVQHPSPEFDSLMDETLRRHTTMQVVRVETRELLKKDQIYLIPSGAGIRLDGADLCVDPRSKTRGAEHPVNAFFQSLADACGANSIAIVLSGTGPDGVEGIRAVKEAGGVVMAQDPDSCGFDGMPQAASGTAAVDLALKPADLAHQTAEILVHPKLQGATKEDLDPQEEGPDFRGVIKAIERETGLNLSAYKPGTIKRRILRRMAVAQTNSMGAYLSRLRSDPAECKALADDCLIHVTSFFRDPKAFTRLQQQLGSLLVAQSGLDKPFRVWVAGCSTGEEAYSIAILLERVIRETGARGDYKIFATDLDPGAVETAARGRFSAHTLSGLNSVELERYFTRDDDVWIVKPQLRHKMVFAKHNVLTDPPFPKADLVTCRNLLIYLRPAAQKAALERIHFSLNVGGLLFLGPSEVIDPLATDYRAVDANLRIFEKIVERRRALVTDTNVQRPGAPPASSLSVRDRNQRETRDRLRAACETLVSALALCGVIVDSTGTLLYSFGDVSQFLKVPKGIMGLSIMQMLPSELAARVRVAMREAGVRGEPVRIEGARLATENSNLTLTVHGIKAEADSPQLFVLVVREESPKVIAYASQDARDMDAVTRTHIAALENQLRKSQHSLKKTIEELEATNEGMQSIQAELLSTNEELQSTNQELHSVNEELYTVNAEHQSKIGELAEVTENLENLLHATRIGMLFVDSSLRVLRFTRDVQLGLPLRDSDVGRSLSDLATTLDIDLAKIAAEVLRTNEPWEERLVTREGVAVLVAARTYGPRHTLNEGCVITIVDLTAQSESSEDFTFISTVTAALPQLKSAVIWVRHKATGRFRYLSDEFERIWGVPVGRCLDDPSLWRRAVHEDDRDRVDAYLRNPGAVAGNSTEYRIVQPNRGTVWIEDRQCGEVAGPDGEELICGVAIDQTALVRQESESRARLGLFSRAMEQLNHNVVLIHMNGEIHWANATARESLSGERSLPESLEAALRGPIARQAFRDALVEVIKAPSGEAGGRVEVTVELNSEGEAEGETACITMNRLGKSMGGLQESILCHWVDRTGEKRAAEELELHNERLQLEAYTDALTGLLNRRGLDKALRDDLALCSRSGGTVVVLLIDCDKFKEINDRHSHTMGDWVLQEIARRLHSVLRPSDALGRIGGDEFVAVLPNTRIAEGAHVGEKLRQIISDRAFQHAGQTLRVTISIGVASAKSGPRSVADLIKYADSLLKHSKSEGRNQVTFTTGGRAEQLVGAKSCIDRILAKGGLSIAMQTINSVETGELVGYELLARSTNTEHGPVDFFAIARAQGRLEELDLCALEACFKRIASLRSPVRFHVNIFPSTFLFADKQRLDAILALAPDPTRVCLELSEQQFIGPSADLRERLADVRRQGFRIGLEDVGYGRSALESLLTIEPEVTKIDRSMVSSIDSGDGVSLRSLKRLVTMMQGMDTEIIAEGVERASQRALLRELGVPLAQGFLWSVPEQSVATV